MIMSNGEVVDEEFDRLGAGHRQAVRCHSADHLIAVERSERPEVFTGEQPIKVSIAERFAWLVKHFGHQREEPPRQLTVTRLQSYRSHPTSRYFNPSTT
jgi:hypothetical protein